MGKRIPLRERWESHVTKGSADACWEWTASTTPSGYGMLWRDGRPAGAHRVAYELFVGPIGAGKVIDHICYNPPCVNPSHLRAVTPKQNNENRSGPARNGSSGYRGVTFHKRDRRWMAQAHQYGKFYSGGYFATAEEANDAAIALRSRLFTHALERTSG